MVNAIRQAELAIEVVKKPSKEEILNKAKLEEKLITKKIKTNEVFSLTILP